MDKGSVEYIRVAIRWGYESFGWTVLFTIFERNREGIIYRLNMILYRPVGLEELELIYDSGMKAFPARMPKQPIFYPVLNH